MHSAQFAGKFEILAEDLNECKEQVGSVFEINSMKNIGLNVVVNYSFF